MDEELSLRPMSFRPGAGKNPFAKFGKGAGQGVRKETSALTILEPVKKKHPSEIVKYSREQLLREDKGPGIDIPEALSAFPELQHDPNNPEEIQAQIDVLQVVTPAGMEADDRDWRARQPAAAAATADGGAAATANGAAAGAAAGSGRWLQDASSQQDGKPAEPPRMAPSGAAAASEGKPSQNAAGTSATQSSSTVQSAGAAQKIQRAADVGQTAWAPATNSESSSGNARALKAVKGVLNKLTPEKFDRLVAQLIENVKSAEVLHGTISLVFENAVAQPTFVGLYAMLCEQLAKQLPEFPAPEGETRPISFQRILLNTCQEEFEGAANARAAVDKAAAEEKEETQRQAKMRTLGNIRLISELFRKKIVRNRIVHMCIQELMGNTKGDPPHEEQVEAVCEMLTITGKLLEADKKELDGYFSTLDRWAKSAKLPPRTRFMIRDVLELRRARWVPRREALQAKKLEEIHAEAHAELGMLPPTLMPMLEALPALAQTRNEDVELFPSFEGADASDGLDFLRQPMANGGMKREGSYSALMGEYKPPPKAEPKPKPAERPAPTPAAPAPAPSTPAQSSERPAADKLTDEEREERAQSAYTEYISSNDLAEAVTCIRELNSAGAGPKLVQLGIDQLMNVLKEREQQMLIALLVALGKQEVVTQADFLQGLHTYTDQLEDLSLDIPKASSLMGSLVGESIREGAISLSHLQDLSQPIESAEPRRDFIAHTLSYLQGKDSKEALQQRITSSSFNPNELLKADPEFDPKDLPNVEAFLKQRSLDGYTF